MKIHMYIPLQYHKHFSENINFRFCCDIIHGKRPEFDPSITKSWICNLIRKCWCEAGSRLTFNEILDELKNNPGFITDSIDKDEYFTYVRYAESNWVEPLLISEKEEEILEDMNDDKPLFIAEVKTLDLNDFEKREQIGCGGFGDVYKINHKQTGHFFAAKISQNSISENLEDTENWINFKREVEIHSSLSHPSIVKFLGFSPIDFDRDF